MRTVFYGRVSTSSDDQLNSLENQISFFDEYIDEQEYQKVKDGVLCRRDGSRMVLEGGYADEGISGKSLRKREAFKQMMIDAKSRKFDLILTKSVARFGRSVEDTSKAVKDLKELGIGVYFFDLKVNSLDNSKEFMINLFASLAQEESNNKSYIVQFGIRKAQQQGKFTGHAPYGYNLVDGFLRINETESEIVKLIYKMYLDDSCGTGKIARYLNAENATTKTGKKWNQIQVSRILDNPIYKGLQIQHVTQTIDINRDIRKDIPEEEWIRHQKDELIIIEPIRFDLVQFEKQRRLESFGHIAYQEEKYIDDEGNILIRKKRNLTRKSGRHSNDYLLSNLIFCANCGSALKRKKRKAHVRKDGTSKDLGYEWACRMNDMYGSKVCAYRNAFPEEFLIGYVKDEIKAYKAQNFDNSFGQFIAAKYNSKNIQQMIEKTELEIAELKEDVKLNFQLLKDKIIQTDEYKERNDEIQAKIKVKQNELRMYLNHENEIAELKFKYEHFKKQVRDFDEEDLSNGSLKKIINKIQIYTFDEVPQSIKEKVIDSKVIKIEWIFMDKLSSTDVIDMVTEAFE